MAQPPKPPLRVVRSGDGSRQANPGVDWKALGLTVGFTTLVSVLVTMGVYGIHGRINRKKNPPVVEENPLVSSPFANAPLALQGGHFVWVPPGQTQRDANPVGLPTALRYTPSAPRLHVVQPEVAPPAWMNDLMSKTQSNEDRLAHIEQWLQAAQQAQQQG